MFALILEAVATSRREHPLVFRFSAASLVFSSLVVAVLRYFRPLGKRRGKNGMKPRLPPGPGGLPLFGSLLEISQLNGDGIRPVVCDNPLSQHMHVPCACANDARTYSWTMF